MSNKDIVRVIKYQYRTILECFLMWSALPRISSVSSSGFGRGGEAMELI